MIFGYWSMAFLRNSVTGVRLLYMSHKSDLSTPERVEAELSLCRHNSALLEEANEATTTIRLALRDLDLPDWEDDELQIVRGHLSRLRKRLQNLWSEASSHEAFVKFQRNGPLAGPYSRA